MIGQPQSNVTQVSRPMEVIAAAGAWLEVPLARFGFRWKRSEWNDSFPVGALGREVGARTEFIELYGDHTNRAGRRLKASVKLWVCDLRLGQWRKTHHPKTALCSGDHLVSRPGNGYTAGTWEIDLRDAAARIETLRSAVERVRDDVLPWFEATSEPELMAHIAPTHTLLACGDTIIEWLASRDRRDLIGVVLDRILSTYPSYRAGYERGHQRAAEGTRPTSHSEDIGWVAAMLGDPDYQPPEL